MELRHLLYFVTIAETLNFRKAAERLNVSQPPLTIAIRNLEAELGTALFTRNSRGVALTAAGESALVHARAALNEADHLRRGAIESRQGERGRLSIGFVGSATYDLLPTLIAAYRKAYPAVDLALVESSTVEITQRVRAFDLDVGLVRLPLSDESGLMTTVVEHDELVIALPSHSPLAGSHTLALSALKAEPFIQYTRESALRRIMLSACHGASFVPQVVQEVGQVYTMLSLVRSGLGVALVPSKATQSVPEGVTLVRLDQPQPIESGVVMAADRAPLLGRKFLDLACHR